MDPGDKLRSVSGETYTINRMIGTAGQGTTYWAVAHDGTSGVIKIYDQRHNNHTCAERLEYLISLNLYDHSQKLCAPVDMFDLSGCMGHFSPIAYGTPLEDWLKAPCWPLQQGLSLAYDIASAISILHQTEISHGDIHPENIHIVKVAGKFAAYIFDFDNFNSPRVPPSLMLGHKLYMAPEVYCTLGTAKPHLPDIKADLYSLAVVIHEILLYRHPITADGNIAEEQFQKHISSATWNCDPAKETMGASRTGFPSHILNAELTRLFRQALSLDYVSRPKAKTWRAALGRAAQSVSTCPRCSGPFIMDGTHTICPHCLQPFPILVLEIKNGHSIPLNHSAIVLDRNTLGGSQAISMRHAVCRRLSSETFLESFGRNGTYRWNGSEWIRLPNNKPVRIFANDRLKFADIEATVCVA